MTDDLFEMRRINSYAQASPDALVVGPRSVVYESIPQSIARKDAMEELEFHRIKADHIDTIQSVSRGLQAAAFCDSIDALTRRFDAFEQRLAARIRAEEEEREAEEQQARIATSIAEYALPPGTSDEDEPPFHPAGDLHSVPASTPEDEEQLEATEDEDPETPPKEDEGPGDLPRELTEEIPAPTGTDPDLSGTPEPTYRNPVGTNW